MFVFTALGNSVDWVESWTLLLVLQVIFLSSVLQAISFMIFMQNYSSPCFSAESLIAEHSAYIYIYIYFFMGDKNLNIQFCQSVPE